jgi:FlaG/FlaF family flagellin (archaellin)
MKKTSVHNDIEAVSPVIAIILMVAITVFFAGVLYIWGGCPKVSDGPRVEAINAKLRQGDGNISNGCLFVLTKGAGNGVYMEDHIIKVCKKGEMPVSLKWPEDGNTTAYNIDS